MKEKNKDKGFLDDVTHKQKKVDIGIHPLTHNIKKRKITNHSLHSIAYGKTPFEPQKIEKPSVSDQIRIASGMDQAVLKFISYANGYTRVQNMMNYISRDFELNMEDQDGVEITDKSEGINLLKSWSAIYFDDKKNSRDVAHLMFSAPHGTDRDIFKKTVREFLKEQYHERHDYVFVAHNDTEHPHIHSMICMRSIQGKKLDPRKKYINSLRKSYASKCRENGIIVDASYRFERGLSGKSLNSKMINMRKKRKIIPKKDIDLLDKIRSEIVDNYQNVNFKNLRKEEVKQHMYNTAKSLYEKSKVLSCPKEIKTNITASKLIFDFCKTMDKNNNRFNSIKNIIDAIDRKHSFKDKFHQKFDMDNEMV